LGHSGPGRYLLTEDPTTQGEHILERTGMGQADHSLHCV
jgi:hypothetical protein